MSEVLNKEQASAASIDGSKGIHIDYVFQKKSLKQLIVFILPQDVEAEEVNPSNVNSLNRSFNSKEWDKLIQFYKYRMEEMNEENVVIKHVYHDISPDFIADQAKQIYQNLSSILKKSKNQHTILHFVALAEGGDLSAHCLQLFSKDDSFLSNKSWHIGSIINIGRPLKGKSDHVLALKDKGKIIDFGNRNDFTQNVIPLFEPHHHLLTQIIHKPVTKIPVTGEQIQINLLKVISTLFLASKNADKAFLERLYNDTRQFIIVIIEHIQKFASLDLGYFKLDDFSEVKVFLDQLNDIEHNTILNIEKIGYNITTDSQNPELMQFFDCFNSLILLMSDFLSESLTQENNLLQKIIDKILLEAGVHSVHTPDDDYFTDLGIEPFNTNELKNEVDQNSEMAELKDPAAVIAQIKSLIAQATMHTHELGKMNERERSYVARGIFILMRPSFKEYERLWIKIAGKIPKDFDSMLRITLSGLIKGRLSEVLKNVSLNFSEELQQNLDILHQQIEKISGFFKEYPSFDKAESLLDCLFKSHSKAIEKCYGSIGESIAESTGMKAYMTAKGYKSILTLDNYQFTLVGKSEVSNPLCVYPV